MRNKIRHHDPIAPPAQRRFRSKRSLRYCTNGGSTPSVLQQIQNAWPQDAWDLRNDLIALSPFVSQEALLEAGNSGILPDAMLFEICMANPDATQDEEFLRILEEDIPNPLPTYMINMIRDSWETETTRTILEYGLAHAGWKRDFNCSALLNNEKLQDEKYIDSIRVYHNLRDNLSDRYLLADSYIEESDFISAEGILDDIAIDFDLDGRKLDDHDNFMLLYDFFKELSDSNVTIFDLDSTKLADLEIIAGAGGWAAVKARNILCYAYGLCVDYPVNTDTASQPKSASINYYDPDKVLNDYYNKLNVRPNPAENFAEFEWELPLLEGKALLRIGNLKGVIVRQQVITDKEGVWIWDTRKIENDTYLYEIIYKGKQLANGKLVILK